MSFDPELFGQAMGEAIRKAVEPLKAEVADLRKKLEEARAQSPDVRQLVVDEVAKIPMPENGKDADESAVVERVMQAIKGDLDRWKADAQDQIKAPELPDIKGMVEAAVSEAVKAIPTPKDGASVTFDDVRPILDEAIRQFRQDSAEALSEPLKLAEDARDSLFKALGEIRQPEDGQSVTLDDVRPVLESAIAESRTALDAAVKQAQEAAQKALDAAESLRQPDDGKSFTLEDAKPIIDKAVELICEDAEKAISEAVSAIPAPKDGDNGTSVTVDDVRPLIEAEIEKAVKQIPAPKDGLGMAGSMIDRDGNLIITMTNGETKNLGPVVGKDGLSLESFEMAYDADAHEVVLKAVSVGKSQEIRYPAGGIHGKGYWRDGNKAKSGEAWTADGSLWIAKKDTGETPSAKSDAWTLAARRGRDGESVVRRVKDGPAAPIKLGGDDAGND